MARPAELVPIDVADRICEHLAGGETLRDFCRGEGFSVSRVYHWLRKDEQFAIRYARARADGAHAIAEDLLAIADNATEETVQTARLRADVRKWLLARWLPSHYGSDRASASSGPAVQVIVQTGVPRSTTQSTLQVEAETGPGGGVSPLALPEPGGEEHNITDPHIPSISDTPPPSE